MYYLQCASASWNPEGTGSLQRITFTWCILNCIPTCIYVPKFGNRTPSPHHSSLFCSRTFPLNYLFPSHPPPVSCFDLHSFISLFLPCRLHNCKVSELHSVSSILGFRHVRFPDRMRLGPFAQSNIATADNHQFHSTPKSQTFPTELTQNTQSFT
jgi:hypothetical protein